MRQPLAPKVTEELFLAFGEAFYNPSASFLGTSLYTREAFLYSFTLNEIASIKAFYFHQRAIHSPAFAFMARTAP